MPTFLEHDLLAEMQGSDQTLAIPEPQRDASRPAAGPPAGGPR